MFYLQYRNEHTGVMGQELDNIEKQSSAWAKKAHASDGSNLDGVPIGAIVDWPVTAAPARWLLCNGQVVSRETYSRLYTVIGVTFGVGDGSTTFTLPSQAGVVGDYLIIFAGV